MGNLRIDVRQISLDWKEREAVLGALQERAERIQKAIDRAKLQRSELGAADPSAIPMDLITRIEALEINKELAEQVVERIERGF